MRCLNWAKLVCWNMDENVIGHCEPSDATAIKKGRRWDFWYWGIADIESEVLDISIGRILYPFSYNLVSKFSLVIYWIECSWKDERPLDLRNAIVECWRLYSLTLQFMKIIFRSISIYNRYDVNKPKRRKWEESERVWFGVFWCREISNSHTLP